MHFRNPFCISMSNFVAIGLATVETQQYFYFSNVAIVHHLGFVRHIFGPPTIKLAAVSII